MSGRAKAKPMRVNASEVMALVEWKRRTGDPIRVQGDAIEAGQGSIGAPALVDSGPYCRHWSDPSDCEIKCARPGCGVDRAGRHVCG